MKGRRNMRKNGTRLVLSVGAVLTALCIMAGVTSNGHSLYVDGGTLAYIGKQPQ